MRDKEELPPRAEGDFSKEAWYVADVNKAEKWAKFADVEFNFVISTHPLEDVRDPLFVSKQLTRVAKRGYIELPTLYRGCATIELSGVL